MRVVIQRVNYCSVAIETKIMGEIGHGLLVLLGIQEDDNESDIEWLTHKICSLRIFDDKKGIMNLSIVDVDGEILVVSQFTLYASTKKGNRPSYVKAAKPDYAIPVYNLFVERLSYILKKDVPTGVFGAMMKLSLTNDGPVTIIIDSKNRD